MKAVMPGPGPISASVWQIGFVVNDLEESLREWSGHTDAGHWVVYTYSHETLPSLEYEGRPARMSYRLAMSQSLVPQIELIQSLEGPSVLRSVALASRSRNPPLGLPGGQHR